MATVRVDRPSSPAPSAGSVSAPGDADVSINHLTRPRRVRRVHRSATSVPLVPPRVLPASVLPTSVLPTSASVDSVLPGSVARAARTARRATTNGDVVLASNGLAPASAAGEAAASHGQLRDSASTEILAIAEQLFGQQLTTNSSGGYYRGSATTTINGGPAGSLTEGVRNLGALERRGGRSEGMRARRGGLSGRRAELLRNPAAESAELTNEARRSESVVGVGGFRVQTGETGGRVDGESAVDVRAINDVDGWWDLVGEMESEMRIGCSQSDCGSLPNSSCFSSFTSLSSSFEQKGSMLASSNNGSSFNHSGNDAFPTACYRTGSVFEPVYGSTNGDLTME
ncbi:hypothetical protein CLOM_g3620 [Closterium sp. NIES-68]|nr:hypothetical protein CLOM_g3620 [Closterium sp. NIES-68]GJP63690.1 hypothetical protein CLOP_g20749 [Closterium sp. NIES-67]